MLTQRVMKQPRVQDAAGIVRDRARACLGKISERGRRLTRKFDEWQQARRR